MYKLYGYWRSSSTWRVRIALNYKGVDYESVSVHLVKDGGEQHYSDFRQKNQMAQVPVLEFVENQRPFFLSQSVAILEYLEEKFPAPALFPSSIALRAKTRQLVEIINSGVQPLQNLSIIQTLRDDYKLDPVPWCTRWIEQGLTAYEIVSTPYAGNYSIGDAVTVADMCLIPQLYNARRFNVDLERFPKLLAIEENCLNHPSFRMAHPDNQPDAQ